jgi:hypothetical protein
MFMEEIIDSDQLLYANAKFFKNFTKIINVKKYYKPVFSYANL